MVGFGFMDNFVMIQAGQYIDSTIGVTLGLATMAAAAAGQVVSDVSGVIFGGTLERTLQRMGAIKTPPLTVAQRQLPIARNVAMAGAVVGVIVGCALGAMTLLAVDLEARDRMERAVKLREIVSDMITSAAVSSDSSSLSLNCERCIVHLEAKKDFTLEKKEAAILPGATAPTHLAFLEDSSSDCVTQCIATKQVVVSNNVLYAPVVVAASSGTPAAVVAVMEYHNKEGQFTPEAVRTVQVMADHLAIVMKHLVEK